MVVAEVFRTAFSVSYLNVVPEFQPNLAVVLVHVYVDLCFNLIIVLAACAGF